MEDLHYEQQKADGFVTISLRGSSDGASGILRRHNKKFAAASAFYFIIIVLAPDLTLCSNNVLVPNIYKWRSSDGVQRCWRRVAGVQEV